MYASLVEWLQFPFFLHRALSKDIAGDWSYAEPVEILGYRVDATEEIIDENNQTYRSSQRVYVDANVQAKVSDMISFPEEPDKKYSIKKVSAFFDGNERSKSISVLYL